MIRHGLILCAAALCLLAGAASAAAAPEPPPSETRLAYGTGKLVPIPESIPHEAGDMVDRRIVPDLEWIAARYPIYVTDGYSGPLPGGKWAGCRGCHVANSDHTRGLAVDIVPLVPSSRCDAKWTAISRLALWAEPRQNRPVAPFRWVGYDGDSGHGCGHHLHLSWNHAPVKKRYELAEWVEVFAAPGSASSGKKPRTKKATRAPKAPTGPSGGISQHRTGGVGTGS